MFESFEKVRVELLVSNRDYKRFVSGFASFLHRSDILVIPYNPASSFAEKLFREIRVLEQEAEENE